MKKGLSQEALKLLACITMLIDHVGYVLVYPAYLQASMVGGVDILGDAMPPEAKVLYTIYMLLRIIGRLSFPIFAFLLFLKLRRMWQNSRLEKYRTYARAIGNSLAISIKELAKTVGKPRSEVRDDLAKMIAKGYLGPEAYVDHSRDMLYILRPAAEDVHAHSGHVNFDFSDLSDIVSDISGIAGEVAHTLKDAFKDTRNAFKDARQDIRTGHNYAPSGTRPDAYAEETQKAGSDEYAEAQKTEYTAYGAYGDEAQKAEYTAQNEYLYNCILDMRLLWTEGTLNLLDNFSVASPPERW